MRRFTMLAILGVFMIPAGLAAEQKKKSEEALCMQRAATPLQALLCIKPKLRETT